MNKYIRKKVNGKMLMKHRYVYQEYIKRPLLRGELIHHKNGDKSDNRIENLEIMKAIKEVDNTSGITPEKENK